ncbi:MAG TPA: hypothetical protein VHQ41_01335 [Patescibacteria group bacterium]|jgi:hypothetical protein|nr:hypothetical protein [Patescibacteria group bacterium]
MRLLLDDDSNRASDAGFKGNVKRVQETDSELFNDDYESNEPAVSESVTTPAESFNNFETKNQPETQRRSGLIEQAKQNLQKGKDYLNGKNDENSESELHDDSPKGRERLREFQKQKARDFASKKIGQKIGDEGMRAGFEKGLSKSASSLAKDKITRKATKEVGEKAVKEVAKKAGQQAGKAAATAAVDTLGAATGVETFGLGFVLAFLLNIAISLGLNDAFDAYDAYKDGDEKQARFLAVRAAAKVGMFIYLLITFGFMISIGGIFFAVPLIILLNIYMLAGMFFKSIGVLQGLVWWEIGIVLLIDLFGFLILAAFIGALGYWLCNSSGLGSGGVTGAIAGAVASLYDWWNQSSAGSVAADFCKYVQGGT